MYYNFGKRFLSTFRFFVVAIFVCSYLILSGCSNDPKNDTTFSNPPYSEPFTLWVLTEETVSDGMNYQIDSVISYFQHNHHNIMIELEVLPTDNIDRSIRLNEIRQSIRDGYGPDIYILPTSNHLVLDSQEQYTYVNVEPLFPDLAVTMRTGTFKDVSVYYDNDIQLDKSTLNQTIMDSGLIHNCRYVLPLRYDLPVLYYFENDLTKLGIQQDITKCTIEDVI